MVKNCLENWRNKILHGQYMKNPENKVENVRNCQWLHVVTNKKETEGTNFCSLRMRITNKNGEINYLICINKKQEMQIL